MGNFYMESTQINYRRDETLKTVDQKLQELSETSAIDTDIAPVFKSTSTYAPGDMVYYRNKLYVFNVEHSGAWAAGDVSATDVTTEVSSLRSGLTNYQTQNDLNLEVPNRKNLFDPNSNLQLGFSNSIGTSGTFTSGSYYAYVVTKRSVPTFTISGVDYTKIEDTSIRVFVSSSYPAVGAAQWRTSNISDLSSKTVTLSENDKYLTFLIKWEDTATQADKESIMVEEGDTATTFAPYIPSVESRIEAVESGLTNLDNFIKARVAFYGTLGNDVLDTAKSMENNTIRFYASSNQPTNRPQDCNWGSYLMYKSNNNTAILYLDGAHIASTYGIWEDVTSINWHIV